MLDAGALNHKAAVGATGLLHCRNAIVERSGVRFGVGTRVGMAQIMKRRILFADMYAETHRAASCRPAAATYLLPIRGASQPPCIEPRATADPRVLAFWANMSARCGPAGDAAAHALSYLRPAIARIVGPPARGQALKGIFTAGPLHAAIYGIRKLSKSIRVRL